MTKKEKKELASKNTKMTDWVRKGAKPVQPIQEPDLCVELNMDWEVAPDMDRTWRKMVAKSRTECNADIKISIRKKFEEEDKEEKLLLEAQGRADRRMRQEVTRSRRLSSREEKDMNDLANSLTNLAVAADEPEKDDDMDEDGDTEMRIEESEAEIDAWLSELVYEVEEHTTDATKVLEDNIMEVEDDNYGENTVDDNDTNENFPDTLDASYEELVVKELDSFYKPRSRISC